ncbi:MAG: META domain-containing protein [Flavobacteriales bacterium]|nr:META domain-containing protein [Flavobacteriales bacterium]
MKLFVIAVLAFVTLSAHTCNRKTLEAAGGDEAATGMSNITSLVGSKWLLRSLGGNAITMPEGSDTPWVRLDQEGSKLEGFSGCNSLFGGFELDGDKIQFPNIGGTKKYCQEVQSTETAFLSALRSTDGFKMDGNALKLLSGDREVAALEQE